MDHSCLNWVFWAGISKKLRSNLKSASSNLLSFIQKQKKKLNLGPKISYLGIFGLQFNKKYYQIFNQHTRICETIKFHPKRKKNRFGTTNAICVFSWNVEKLMSYF